MARKDVELVADTKVAANDILPKPKTDFRTAFEALPIKVIVRSKAEERIMLIGQKLDVVVDPNWLTELPIDHLERVYRRRMNTFKINSGMKTFVVESPDLVPARLAELQEMFAALNGVASVPSQSNHQIVLPSEPARELQGAVA